MYCDVGPMGKFGSPQTDKLAADNWVERGGRICTETLNPSCRLYDSLSGLDSWRVVDVGQHPHTRPMGLIGRASRLTRQTIITPNVGQWLAPSDGCHDKRKAF